MIFTKSVQQPTIPSIDTLSPTATETATFALG